MGIKYKINYDFFKTWSKQMAYVLGFLFADGSLENSPYIRGKYIRFSNTEPSIIKKIKRIMDSKHRIVKMHPPGNRKVKYFLRIGSHLLYNDLEKLGLFPNKSSTMTFPKVPDSFISDFVRGYFDGDGSVIIERYKRDKKYKRLKAIFTSGSKKFLISLDRCLQGFCNIDGPNFYNSHRSFQLVYRSLKAKKVLDFLYKDLEDSLYLRRKYLVYKKALKQLKFKKWRRTQVERERSAKPLCMGAIPIVASMPGWRNWQTQGI